MTQNQREQIETAIFAAVMTTIIVYVLLGAQVATMTAATVTARAYHDIKSALNEDK